MKAKRFFAVLLSLIIVAALFCSCGKQFKTTDDKNGTAAAGQTNAADSDKEDASKNENKDKNKNKNDSEEDETMEHPLVKVKMENGGEFTIELYPEYAPATVENFLKLVNDGFYNGLTFHRVVAGFMAQGGDPEGTGMGGSPDKIKGEFSSNGFTQNTLSHTRGVISMARSAQNDSASSQFFICYGDCSALDGSYAAFGKVIDGMEVVDGFCDTQMTYNSMGERAVPVVPIYIDTMTQVK